MAKKQQTSSLTPYLQQAQLQAAIKFNPTLQGLAQLVRQAKTDYSDTVASAKTSNAAQQSAITAAVPQIQAAYDQARAQNQAVGGIVDNDLAKIGPVSGQSAALQQAMQLERNNAGTGLNATQAGLTAGLQQQSVDTVKAAQAGVTQAGTTKRRALADIAQQVADTASQQGDFIQATAGGLLSSATAAQAAAAEKAAARATQVQVANIGANASQANAATNAQNDLDVASIGATSRETVAQTAADAKKAAAAVAAKAASGRTKTQTSSFLDEVTKAQRAAKLLGAGDGNTDRASLESALVDGYSATTKQVPVLNKDGKKVYDRNGVLKTRSARSPGLKPSTTDPLAAQAALDLAQTGKIQRTTLTALHKAGYSIADLGLPYQSAAEGTAKQAVSSSISGAGSLIDQLIKSLRG